MLPKIRRIERSAYPKEKPTKSLRGRFASISIFPFNQKTKFSFTISKKTAKTAVLRNKIRRAGYRTISTFLPKIRDGFLVRFSIYSIPTQKNDLENDIKNLLIKTDILNTK